MKKILYTIVLLMACSIGSMAQRYYLQGESSDISYSWTATYNSGTNNANEMVSYKGSDRYYIVRKITVGANTTKKFRVRRTNSNGYFTYDGFFDYNNTNTTATQGDKAATLYFENAGTYWVVFTLDKGNNSSLDAVLMAHISQDYGNVESPLWTEHAMTYDETDGYFHQKQDVHISKAGTQGSFKAKVYHRSTANAPVWYGTGGYGAGDNISVNVFPEAGDYEIEFLLDPVQKTAPWYDNVKGYLDYTMPADGYATFSYHKVVDVPASLKAQFITSQNATGFFATATKQIPKTTSTPQQHTGAILKGIPGETYRLYWSTDQTATVTGSDDNLLYGTGSNTYAATAETYVFANKSGVIGFYLGTAGTFATNKAFLMASDVTTGGSAREFFPISFDGENTLSVDAMSKQPTADCHTYYNLQGQPVAHPTKGLYIVDGRKVVVK